MQCRGNIRHWFTYHGMVGSSAPTCQHAGCDAPNPNYDPDRDPHANEEPRHA